jgi:minor histocompatibility antigen H13
MQIDYFNLEFDTHDLVSLVLFSSVGIAHVMYRHWITNDIIGVAFSLYGIEMLHLSSFKVCFTYLWL